MPELSVPTETEPRPTSPSQKHGPKSSVAAPSHDGDPSSRDHQAFKNVRSSLDATGRVCTPVLFGLLAPGGLGGLLLLAWLLFA
jgi:hypothetical protein